MAIGPHIYGSWHITKPKKNEKKNVMLTYKIFSFFLRQWFFPKNKSLLCDYCSRSAKKQNFWMDFQPKIVNF
jgi:hypothetical protein